MFISLWPLAIIGTALGLCGSAMLGATALRVCRRTKVLLAKTPDADARKIGIIRSSFTTLLGVTFLSLATTVFASVSALGAYHAFARKELVARVRCMAVKPDKQQFHLLYTPIFNGVPAQEDVYEIAGDQWTVEGDILKWKPFMNVFGFKSLYKTTRVAGRYVRAADEITKRRTAYDINGGTDEIWEKLYRKQNCFPYSMLAEAVYGSSGYQFPDDKAVFNVYVTSTGYMIEKVTTETN